MMPDTFRMLLINVGSTSTKIACYLNGEATVTETVHHEASGSAAPDELRDQLPGRYTELLAFLHKHRLAPEHLDLIISRGGMGKPGPAGAYRINAAMCNDLLAGTYGRHPSGLGPAMALALAVEYNKPAVVVDPPSTDEFQPLSRISGLPEIERQSAFHALNQKAAARRAARDLGKTYEAMQVVVAHLGGGITIGAHRRGRVIDCTHGLSEGPFTPERAGSLPTKDLVALALAGAADPGRLRRRLVGQGGLAAYLGTTDARKITERIQCGDRQAALILQAMAYQIAKDIGAMGVVLEGKVDAVILTGGLAHAKILTGWIRDRVAFIAPVLIYPGEDEMAALAEGGLRILQGTEQVRDYPPEEAVSVARGLDIF